MHNHDKIAVSVLMPVYNGVPFLEAAIESIRQQSYRDFEFILVDDGSTDGSREVLARFAAEDPRLRVELRMHQGVVGATNHGLAVAKGGVIFLMDQDDVAMPERIERQLAFLAAHPEVAAVGSAMRFIDGDGVSQEDGLVEYPLAPQEIREGLLAGACTLGNPSVALRRDAVLAVGGYRQAFDYAEDYDMWLRLSERWPLANLPDVLVHYRWHGGNVSIRHAREQVLAAYVARLAAREREGGRPDPTAGLDRLCVKDLDRFYLPADERAAMLRDLTEVGLSCYRTTGEARNLAHVEESLYARGHPRDAAAQALAAELAQHLWKAGQPHRAAAATAWRMRAAAVSGIARRATPLADRTAGKITVAGRRRRTVHDWLIHCADPLGPRTPQPGRQLSPGEAGELVELADKHGVLQAVLQNFPAFQGDDAFAEAKAQGLARHRSKLAYSLMLRSHGEAIMAAAAGLPVAMVKGPVFSDAIYPARGFRYFTDIDLLVAPEAETELGLLLEQHGFKPADYACDPDRQERKWVHADNDALMIEVHTNLVHHPELRSALSLDFAALAGIAGTPAGLLTVALVHGALERYELLRHVVDICMAARKVETAAEERRLSGLVERTGARFAAVAGLQLAYRLLGEQRCRELAQGLGPARHAGLARALLGRSTIASTMDDARIWHSWRRQLFRQLVKRGGARPA